MNGKLTLRDHEVKRLLSTGDVLVVRPVKPQPEYNAQLEMWVWPNAMHGYASCYPESGLRELLADNSPYPVSSRWWVREVFNARDVVYDEYCGGYEAGYPLNPMPRTRPEYRYVVDYKATDGNDGPWRSPIHMPRWASRVTLEVTDVRAERLQDITEDSAIAEGVTARAYPAADYGYIEHELGTLVGGFGALWDSINAKRGYPWSSNPWVWVIGFRKAAGGDE